MRLRLILMPALISLACQDPQDASFRGEFRIKLVDAPAVYDAVNILVERVSVHRASASPTFGWTVVSEERRTYNLLDLRNGVSATLVSASLPVGRYDKVLVKYGTSSLLDDGFDRTVYIPDDLKDGAIVDADLVVSEGEMFGLTFDMDVSRSIRTSTDGRFLLRPVIRVQRTDLAGSIAGGIAPDSVLAVISTTTGTDSVSTYSLAIPGINSFQLVDLPEGTYQLDIHSTHPGFLDTTLTDVTVVARQTTQIGAISLRPRPALP